MNTIPFGNTTISQFDGVANSKLHLVNSPEQCDEFFRRLSAQKSVACDTETDGFDWFKSDRVIGMSFGWGVDDNYYIPIRHSDSVLGGRTGYQTPMESIIDRLKAFFTREDVTLIFHNFKFDSLFYRAEGVEITALVHDTALLWHLYDENAPVALKDVATGWVDDLGIKQKGLISPDANQKEKEVDKWRSDEAKARRKVYGDLVKDEVTELASNPENQGIHKRDLKKQVIASAKFANHEYVNAGKEDVHYGYVPIDLMTEYASLDVFFTWELFKFCMKNMEWNPELKALYINELKLSSALREIEYNGICIDIDYFTRVQAELLAEDEELGKLVAEKLGNINLNSNAQLAEALVAQGVVLVKQTDTGNLSVDSEVLEELEDEYPIVADLRRLRLIRKLRTTYVEALLEKAVGNVVHCNFNQNVSTGRMSLLRPNLSNIPGRDKTIRAGFVGPDPDEFEYYFADYSQVEVRLTAHASQDPLLLDAYKRNQDVHTRTFCEVHNHFYEEVSAILKDKKHPKFEEYSSGRTAIKRTVFGIVYSVSAFGLSKQIKRQPGYSKKQWENHCGQIIDLFLDKYLGVKRFINASYREIAKNAKVTTVFGRVRRLPHAKACTILRDHSKAWLERSAQRQGTNFKIQGTAADLFKIAVVRVHNLFKGKKSRIVNLVHDEIQFYLHKSERHLLPEIKRLMEDFPQFTVPIIAEFSRTDTSWAEKESIEV
jgi:DNA polymerase I-like protein with 3'-5' exonuclease and polymerase domains